MGQPFGQRVKVVGPAVAGGAVLAGLFASKLPEHALELSASIMAGPFADAIGWALVCGVTISAHPLRAGLLTGLVSVAGVVMWVFLGLALTFDGV